MAPTTPTLLLSPQHPPPPPQPVFSITPDATHHRVSPLLIAMVVLLSSSLLVAVSYFLYSALSPSPPRSRRPYPRLHDQSMGVFNYHLGWYVATVGLQRSVIESIAVCEYNKGDGLVHRTGCAVCLAEFEDGESIRMLPMCRHAFHVPCIDTWLASRTTCPICRAPVLPAGLPDEGAHSIEIGDGLGPGLSLAVSVQDEGGEVERGVGRTIRRAASMENLGGKPSPSSCSSASSSSSCGSLAERSLSCSGNLFSSSHNESR